MKPSAISRALETCYDARLAAFIWGPPGVGKSAVVKQLAERRKLDLRDVRLALLDPIDLKGFPQPDVAKKQMTWLPPDFLPHDPKSKGVLFLDELNSAPQAVQAAGYQLVLDRRIGNYVLPDGWAVFAAGNRQSDRSVVNAMPAALANRFVHLDFEVDVDDLVGWAIEQGKVREEMIAWWRFRARLVHLFDPDRNPRAFPSPRTWMMVNEMLGKNLPLHIEQELIKGTVGDEAASEFIAFQRVVRDLPDIDAVLMNPKTFKLPTEANIKYALTTTLALRATTANFDAIMEFITRMDPEFQVVFARDAIRRDDKLTTCDSYGKWALKNRELLR